MGQGLGDRLKWAGAVYMRNSDGLLWMELVLSGSDVRARNARARFYYDNLSVGEQRKGFLGHDQGGCRTSLMREL